ncbi:MAG: hypothetical protein ACFFDI_16310 [Promethearchaeota archaeon]
MINDTTLVYEEINELGERYELTQVDFNTYMEDLFWEYERIRW